VAGCSFTSKEQHSRAKKDLSSAIISCAPIYAIQIVINAGGMCDPVVELRLRSASILAKILRLELIYEPDAVENMREVVRREQRCCAFLSFSIHENQDFVRVVIRVPPEARELARMVFEFFLGKAAIVPGLRRRC
jgi:hypothetical protein